MKKRMYWSLCLASVLAVAVTAALTLWSVYGVLLRQAQDDLAQEHKLLVQSMTYAGPEKALDYLNSLDVARDSFRITVVDRQGTVLFDSDNNAGEMENHLSRPEIQAALAGQTGLDVRQSATMDQDTVYYAAQLDSDTVLRVSLQTRSVEAVFLSVVPLMLAVLVVMVVMSVWLSSRLTRRLLQPIQRLSENLDAPDSLEGYQELEPFFARIREQKHLIREQMDHLRAERDTISTITSNMREGLLLLNQDRQVLSYNRGALELLQAPQGEYEGKSVLTISRVPELGSCVEQALAGRNADLVVPQGDRYCHIFANPVTGNGGGVCGVILLLLDVTEQQRAERIRREFTANVSHELKTPLTSISGFAELMESGMTNRPEEVRHFAGRIRQEAGRLITLTDDIIRLSRIEDGTALDREPVELLRLGQETAESLQFLAEQKQVSLSAAGQPVTVQADRRMLEELCYNLLENAVKYNHPGGWARLEVRPEGDSAVLTVSDNGIGIPQEHQQRIFERFYRVDKSRSKQTGGTGLGLSIVKHIVERHGGVISLQSEPEKGTTITVRLPLQPV